MQKCRSLIEKGVNVNVRHDGSNKYIAENYLDLTPVDLAIQKNQDLILNLLIENGAEVPDDALISAVKHDAQKAFNFLLGRDDIDINHQDEHENTALHHVFEGYIHDSFGYSDGRWELKQNGFAESLLDKGAQFDVKNKNGLTSFDLFIDSIRKNKDGINFYSSAINKESIDTYQINVKQKDRLSSILELFVNNGIDQLKFKNDKPALHVLEELGLYQRPLNTVNSLGQIRQEKLNSQQTKTNNPIMDNESKKFLAASDQDRKQVVYASASASFVLSGLLVLGAFLTISYLALCTSLTVAALALFAVGCYCLYKASTALSNVEINQAAKDTGSVSFKSSF